MVCYKWNLAVGDWELYNFLGGRGTEATVSPLR